MGVLRLYSNFVFRRPLHVILGSICFTALIPLILLFFFPVKLTQNAEIGFDTKDTVYSGVRLAWQRLQYQLTTGNRIFFANSPGLLENVTNSLPEQTQSLSRQTLPSREDTLQNGGNVSQTRNKRGWAENLLFAVQNVPCYEAPIPLMNHLMQVVIELESMQSLFDMELLKKLCNLHNDNAKQISAFDAYTPYRNVWSAANYIACLSPNLLVNCTELTQADIETVHSLIDYCSVYRRTLVDCKVACAESCTECEAYINATTSDMFYTHLEMEIGNAEEYFLALNQTFSVPKNCTTQMMFDLFYRLLPEDLHSRPFYLNTFLPAFTLTGYATQNMEIPLHLYDDLEKSMLSYFKKQKLHVKGILMDVKRERLLSAAIGDSLIALLAAAIVLTVVAIQSRSVSYALAVLLTLVFAVLAALAVYGLFTSDFPLLNLVIFVLLIAVGTDDAFLLHSNFPEDLNEKSFFRCMEHTYSTISLTSFSTAVPFFVNLLSNVIVFRCFGLFAGVTMVFNWFLVISFLPAFLVAQQRYCSCLPSLPDLSEWLSLSVKQILPAVILQGRFVWLSSLSIVCIGMGWAAVRDLRLPEYNPLQLFVSSNLHEWYDNNAEITYEFVAAKIALPLFARVVWGVKPVESHLHFSPDPWTPLELDPSFHLSSVEDVRALSSSLHHMRSLSFVNHSEPFWPEKFMMWSHGYPCLQGFLCCNVSSSLFSTTYLDYCLRNSTSYIITSYNDTPIFDNLTFALTGYTALIPTHLKYNHRFGQLSHAFEQLAQLQPAQGGWWAPEWALMSTWFDLQRSIISDCRSSVLISLVVVAAFAFVQLRLKAFVAVFTCACVIVTSVGTVVLLGWVIGVLEAVIVVLVVGLSFDYTLHYGAAIPDEGCGMHRLSTAASLAAAPVSLAAFTSFLAGACMLFTATHAFFQVGTFLVVVTGVSWLYATFFFLPLMSFFLPNRKDCSQCNRISIFPLKSNF